ncbi:hypothetical protein ACFVMS_004478 [Salmonella enterica]
MKNGKSYLYKELIQLRLKTFFLAIVVFFRPSLKDRCVYWFMREADYLLDYAENGLLNSKERKLVDSISVFARRLDERCGHWCQDIIDCSLYIESEWKNAGNC